MIISTNLVCILFGPAILCTSSFKFVLILVYHTCRSGFDSEILMMNFFIFLELKKIFKIECLHVYGTGSTSLYAIIARPAKND